MAFKDVCETQEWRKAACRLCPSGGGPDWWCPTTGKSNRIGGRGKHNNGVRLTTIDEKCLGFIVWMTAFVLHHLTGFVTNFECGFIDSVTSKSFIVAWTFTIGYTFTLAALIMVCLRPMKECGTKKLARMKMPLTPNQVCGGAQRVTVGLLLGSIMGPETPSTSSHRLNYPNSRLAKRRSAFNWTSLLFLALCQPVYSTNDVYVNEAVLTGMYHSQRFIELRADARRAVSLCKYKLVVIQDYEIVVTADLGAYSTTDTGAFVIGNVPEADLKISDKIVKTKLKYTSSGQKFDDRFVDESNSRACTIILLFGHAPEVHIFEYSPFINLQNNIKIATLLREHLADMLVVGHEPPLQSLDPLRKCLFPHWKFWWQKSSPHLPLSMNSCDSALPVKNQGAYPAYRYYQLGVISPGVLSNHCSGEVKVEDLLKFDFPVGGKSDDVQPAPPGAPNAPTGPEIQEPGEAMDSKEGQASPEAMDTEKAKEFLWKTTNYFFEGNWIDFWREFQADTVPWKYIEQHTKTQYWVEGIRNEDDLTKSTLGCWKCRLFAQLLMLAKKRITALGSAEGKLSESKVKNIRALSEHEKDPIHIKIDKTMELYQVETKQQFFKVLKTIRAELIRSTANQFDTIFFEALTGVPYEDHPLLTKLQIRNGASLGHHLFSSTSAMTITDYIADKGFLKMVNWLISSGSPCSLLIDESVDSKHRNVLVIMIQVVYNNAPIVWTYKSIEITEGTGEAIFKAILAEWERDGTDAYFAQNMYSFVADGASKNVGYIKGAAAYFQDFCDNDIIITWCMAHRSHLAAKWGWKELPFMKDLEKFNNQIYKFYRNKSHKRKDHIYATSVELGTHLYELTQVHQIRFISSELWALEVLKRNYKILVTDLLKIMDDHQNFDEEVRGKAAVFYNTLTSRQFVVMLNFTIDVLKYLSLWSKQLQRSNGTLFDKKRFKDKTLQNLRNIIYDGGDTFSKLLRDAECWGRVGFFLLPGSYRKEYADRNKCSENEIYSSSNVRWMGVDLSPLDALEEGSVGYFPKVGDIRSESLITLREKITEYFPDDKLLDALSYLDPSGFPEHNTDNLLWVYFHISRSSMVVIANRLGMTEDAFWSDLVEQWKRFVLHLASVPEQLYKEQRKLDSADFWKIFLDKKEPHFVIGPNLRKVLERSLALGMGTSSVERNFSILGALHTKERNKLSLKHRNSMLFIRTNMRMELEDFPSEEYAEQWYEDGHLMADDPIVEPKTSPKEKAEGEVHKLFSKNP